MSFIWVLNFSNKVLRKSHKLFNVNDILRTVGKTNMKDASTQTILALHKFSRNQRLLLKQSPELLLAIGKGAAMAIQECKRQFSNNRWNCSDYSPESVFGKILHRGKKMMNL